jgi:hypothetical protein
MRCVEPEEGISSGALKLMGQNKAAIRFALMAAIKGATRKT